MSTSAPGGASAPATAATEDGADNPLLEYLGIRLVDSGIGSCCFALAVGPRHLNRQRSLQGGVIATLLDAACGYAGLCASSDGPSGNAVTINLSVNFVARVASGTVRAHGRVVRAGRNIYFAEGQLVADDGCIVATAHGSFKRSTTA